MKEQFQRTAMLIGEDSVEELHKKRVAVFGVGGVGGYVCEALVRSGVGAFDLIDKDCVDITNLNRQIIATQDTVGRPKVQVMKERMLSINPDVDVRTYECFFLPENAANFPFEEYDYVVDAVDTVTAKIELIMRSQAAGVPVISAMGAGNKLDASAFKVADIYKTNVCPLAKVMRRELKKRGVKKLKVVYSEEQPMTPMPLKGQMSENVDGNNPEKSQENESVRRKATPGSIAFSPAACGLVLASEIIKDLYTM